MFFKIFDEHSRYLYVPLRPPPPHRAFRINDHIYSDVGNIHDILHQITYFVTMWIDLDIDLYNDKRVQEIRLDTFRVELSLRAFQKHNAHDIISNVSFSLQLYKRYNNNCFILSHLKDLDKH